MSEHIEQHPKVVRSASSMQLFRHSEESPEYVRGWEYKMGVKTLDIGLSLMLPRHHL
jgi:hypothetical protein